MSSDLSDAICCVITRKMDMNNRPRNQTIENVKTLSNDIDESLWSFANVFEPINNVRTIRFDQKKRGRWPSGSRRKKQTFSNTYDFS